MSAREPSRARSGTEAVRFEPDRLQALRARLQGSALVPGDDGYDAARRTWNVTTFEQHPAIVVLPAVAADVVSAVTFAREHQLPIAVQGGGHGHPYPADGALFVNFAKMTRVEIAGASAESAGAGTLATARIEAGARWRDVIQAAHPHGLAPLNGFAGSVGVVGYLLGGGIGWLARQYGAAAGSIRSADLVTADGQRLQVDERSHPDLLWALRGGGGNFGIVTAIEVALYPVKEVFGGQVVYPIAQGREVLGAYLQWAKTVPDELTSALRIIHLPPAPEIPPALRGASVILIMACYNGARERGEALLQPVRTLATPLLDSFGTIPYAQVGTIANDPPEAPPVFTSMDSGGFRDFPVDAIETVLRIAGDRASGIFLMEIRHLGGALARQPAEAMAFALRRAAWYLMAFAAAPSLEALDVGKRSLETMMQALKAETTGEILINALDVGNPSLARAAYSPENYRRLVALKDRYDPENVFRFNHNIPPSSHGAHANA